MTHITSGVTNFTRSTRLTFTYSPQSWFEWQAALSRIAREGQRILRDLYLIDEKNYVLDIDRSFVEKADELNLHLRFASLRGADLIFACAAVIENATLVTRDAAFVGLDGLRVIIPQAPVDEEGYELSFWGGRVADQTRAK